MLPRRLSGTAAPAPLVRIAQCRLRRPAPQHHAAAPPRCATCCRKRAPHQRITCLLHSFAAELHLVHSCRCKPCSALLAATFFAYRQSFLQPEQDLRRRRPNAPSTGRKPGICGGHTKEGVLPLDFSMHLSACRHTTTPPFDNRHGTGRGTARASSPLSRVHRVA